MENPGMLYRSGSPGVDSFQREYSFKRTAGYGGREKGYSVNKPF
jgi:hypothetical protein